MPKFKVLSGKEVLKIFMSFGFIQISQRGSHIKLNRMQKFGKQTLTIPNHDPLDKGTLHAIYKQGLKYIPEAELFSHFYNQ